MHNGYLDILLNIGIAGLAVCLLLLLSAGWLTGKHAPRLLPPVLVIALHGAVDFDWSYSLVWLLLLLLPALALADARQKAESSSVNDSDSDQYFKCKAALNCITVPGDSPAHSMAHSSVRINAHDSADSNTHAKARDSADSNTRAKARDSADSNTRANVHDSVGSNTRTNAHSSVGSNTGTNAHDSARSNTGINDHDSADSSARINAHSSAGSNTRTNAHDSARSNTGINDHNSANSTDRINARDSAGSNTRTNAHSSASSNIRINTHATAGNNTVIHAQAFTISMMHNSAPYIRALRSLQSAAAARVCLCCLCMILALLSAHMMKGASLYKQAAHVQEAAERRELLRESLKWNPLQPGTAIKLSRLLPDDEVAAVLLGSLKYSPENAAVHWEIAGRFMQGDDPGRALQWVRRSLRLDVFNASKRIDSVRGMLAMSRRNLQEGKQEEAVASAAAGRELLRGYRLLAAREERSGEGHNDRLFGITEEAEDLDLQLRMEMRSAYALQH